MALVPFNVLLQDTLASGGTATLSRQVPDGQKWTITALYQKSTGAFNVTNIRNGTGQYFGNFSPSNALPNDFIPDVENGYNAPDTFKHDVVINGGDSLYIDIVDTSASSNLVQIVIEGILDTGGQ